MGKRGSSPLFFVDKSTLLCYTNLEVSERLQFGQGCLVVQVRPKKKTNSQFNNAREVTKVAFLVDLTTYLWYNRLNLKFKELENYARI